MTGLIAIDPPPGLAHRIGVSPPPPLRPSRAAAARQHGTGTQPKTPDTMTGPPAKRYGPARPAPVKGAVR